MKKHLFLYAVLATALLLLFYRSHRAEIRRLTQNQQALACEVTHFRTRAGQEAAANDVLRLRCREFETLRAADAAEIRRLGLKIRRIEATGKTVTATTVELAAPLRDTLVVRLRDSLPVADTLRAFRWRDAWVSIEGVLAADSVRCRIRSTDTLRQIVHRIPHRFLFLRWGTKALRQQIVSSNPHTRIIYTEYVRIEQ